ncbi:capping protein inhibiting regulator of actin dynamics isoform X2 [Choloepus didactylus]|nr:capping protein inhibiting regulator of actin dynamics isoform X2 [Choloepus didactylus]
MKKADSGDASLDEDLFLTSPMEIVTHQDIVLSDTENKSSDTPSSLSPLNLPGARSEMEEKVAPVKPSRPKRHLSSAGTIESVNLDAIPLAIARLDNSAAKHKLSVKPKNQRVSKKHRHLARDRQNEQGGLQSQPSLDQNGHPGENKQIWQEEEPEPLDLEEEKRCQEEYWRELEAKCKRQKAEAAEKRRLEEEKLQALERRLWEENRRQQLLEEEGEEEEGKEGELQLEAEKSQQEDERRLLEERGCQVQELEERKYLEAEEQMHLEAKRLEEKLREQEELEAQRRLEAERQWQEEERELKELRRLEEMEEQRRQEAERRLEELKQQEELDKQPKREEDKQRCQEEEEKRMKELKSQEELEEQRQQDEVAKKLQLEEEEARREELKKQEEMEEKRRQEEAAKQLQEEEAKRQHDLKKQEETEKQRWQEAKKEHQEVLQRPEEESTPEPEEKGRLRSPLQSDSEEKPEQENVEPRKQRESSEEPSIYKKQNQEATPSGEQQGKSGDWHEDDHLVQEKREETNIEPPSQKKEGQVEEMPAAAVEKKEAVAPEKDRKGEELRWQEVDERQSMPRPYTFQVSSGGKQILFPKVNLSPVTPARDASPAPAPLEPKAHRASPAAHGLPSSLSVPHTAILVTGAQLCGPAVNLHQIKDTACKSLLGLSEEKKHVDLPTRENPPRAPGDARAGSGKGRPPQESSSSAAALAEWASIRSRILKGSESEQRGGRDPLRPAEEHAPRGRRDSRGNLRKTQPVNAKFSIMPAWQKFSEGGMETSKQSTEAESLRKRAMRGPREEAEPHLPAAGTNELRKSPEKLGMHQEPTDTTEGCKFAKDLPSFLVPSLPSPPQKAMTPSECMTASESETLGDFEKPDHMTSGGEEKTSPFGIKLRRTSYSLRFHCDQQTEQKKKKRHSSTGDGAGGGMPALGSANGEKETEGPVPKHGPLLTPERKQALSENLPSHSPPAAQPGPPPPSGQTPAPDHDKVVNKMPLAQKPALAPKPTGQTPPSSPLSKLSRPSLVELLARRGRKPDPEPSERAKESQQSDDTWQPSPPAPEERRGRKKDEEEEAREKKHSSLALCATRQETLSQTSDAGRKEKPVLQSRHSLDGSKLTEKGETVQPLWITLALQKQKGFREQHATREERKQAREAKQAEKLSKESVAISPQPGSSSVSRAGSLHKSTIQPEEKKPETAASRLERREQLKKANTLPTSVTVEISDSAPPTPLVKEVTKRFSTPDAAPVSTEPAWLALAKRKAKAWSDCPQIIK